MLLMLLLGSGGGGGGSEGIWPRLGALRIAFEPGGVKNAAMAARKEHVTSQA